MTRKTDQNRMPAKNNRALLEIITGMATSDGDGVKLTRIIGSPKLSMLDPFLLLDYFSSDEAQDYIGGFPTHPHRGFETVTYLLNGRMRHKDSTGHEGVIEPGGVQWMTAGRGILHSEMPDQENGLLQGFQLWVNLPMIAKMAEPKYQEYPPESMPVETGDNGAEIRIIAGKTNRGTVGPVVNDYTEPTYLDVTLPIGTTFLQCIPPEHNAFIYVIEGILSVVGPDGDNTREIVGTSLGVLGQGAQLSVVSNTANSRFLFVAGKPLNEPVARGGPFVMNTREEIVQAYDDFSRGQF